MKSKYKNTGTSYKNTIKQNLILYNSIKSKSKMNNKSNMSKIMKKNPSEYQCNWCS